MFPSTLFENFSSPCILFLGPGIGVPRVIIKGYSEGYGLVVVVVVSRYQVVNSK